MVVVLAVISLFVICYHGRYHHYFSVTVMVCVSASASASVSAAAFVPAANSRVGSRKSCKQR